MQVVGLWSHFVPAFVMGKPFTRSQTPQLNIAPFLPDDDPSRCQSLVARDGTAAAWRCDGKN